MKKGGHVKTLTKEQYIESAKRHIPEVCKGGKLLTECATLLDRAQDFSPAVLEQVRACMAQVAEVREYLKSLEDEMVVRGRTFASEQYDATLALIKK